MPFTTVLTMVGPELGFAVSILPTRIGNSRHSQLLAGPCELFEAVTLTFFGLGIFCSFFHFYSII